MVSAITMRFTAVINKEEDLYVAWCPDLDIASQGKDIEGALENLKEAIGLYLEDEDAEYPKTSPFLTTLEVKDVKIARRLRAWSGEGASKSWFYGGWKEGEPYKVEEIFW